MYRFMCKHEVPFTRSAIAWPNGGWMFSFWRNGDKLFSLETVPQGICMAKREQSSFSVLFSVGWLSLSHVSPSDGLY